MADLTNGDIAAAITDVRDDKTSTAWVLLGYESKTSNKVIVQGKGDGSLEEMKPNLKDDECQFAYLRVTVGDEESKRAKFVFVSWVGESVSPLRRAKMSVHKADVKAAIKNFAMEIHATVQGDLDMDKITSTLLKVGGANYSANTGK